MGGKLVRKMLPHQIKMIYSKAKFPALVTGFGGGKTETLVMKSLKHLFEIDNCVLGVYEPTIDLIKKILYPRYEEILSNANLLYNLNKSEGTLEIAGVGKIIFRSLDNPSRIIGYEVHHSHVDELDTLPRDKAEDAWQKIMSRNRKRIPNNAINTISVYTTPEGYKFVYDRWDRNVQEGYELIRGSTYDNIFLPPEYIADLEASYPKNLIRAYLNGEFVNLANGTVYPMYDPLLNDTDGALRNDSEHLHIGMDFNVGHMSAVIGVTRGETFNEFHIIEEISDEKDTPAIITEIKSRYDGHPITVYPDASGGSVKSVDASKSDIGLLREAGFFVKAPKKNPPVRQRVVTVNTMLCNARDERRLFINRRACPELSTNLAIQAYDDYGQPQKTHNVDHLPDALGYVVERRYGVSAPKAGVRRFRL